MVEMSLGLSTMAALLHVTCQVLRHVCRHAFRLVYYIDMQQRMAVYGHVYSQ